MFSFSNKLVLGIGAIFLSYFYTLWIRPVDDNVAERIINAWKSQIIRPTKGFSRITVGVNTNVDLIVRGTALLSALGVTPGQSADHAELTSLAHLQQTFAYYLSLGGAAERHFVDADVFRHVVKTAAELPNAQWYVGGNAALITQTISSSFPDVSVELVGPVGPRLARLLSPLIRVAAAAPSDEVHLILEYDAGEGWGGVTAPVASRFITSHDDANGDASSLELLFETVRAARPSPDLIVLSGLHMLEGRGQALRAARLGVLAKGLSALPSSLPVHLELASLADPQFMVDIADGVLPLVTSLGLNEQELAFASAALGGPHGAALFLPSGRPAVDRVVDTVVWLLRRRPDARLSRVHFHSLSFHVIVACPAVWRGGAAAVAAGTLAAGRQACDTAAVAGHQMELRMAGEQFTLHAGAPARTIDPDSPVVIAEHAGFLLAFSPVLVCKHPLKTVGLGDAISATGLLHSEFTGS